MSGRPRVISHASIDHPVENSPHISLFASSHTAELNEASPMREVREHVGNSVTVRLVEYHSLCQSLVVKIISLYLGRHRRRTWVVPNLLLTMPSRPQVSRLNTRRTQVFSHP
ncbi:unnamed protein product [Periconia digitata]|uniref:Uncharacterized protein n=1 Tax=Periconia digitata TaxID=1303443 RepID=A0A9W4UQZ0_9PLEO|nr:unnamed protein product [Periconia digitata]